MGWKTVKDHYQIKHIVHIYEGNLAIGSSMCSDLFTFSMEGEYLKGAISHITDEIESDSFPWAKQLWEDSLSGKLGEILKAEDSFRNLITVWTHDYEKVIEKQAEKLAYPECCTDGELIYQNTHYATEKEAKEDLALASVYRFKSLVENCWEEMRDLERRKNHAESAFIGLVKGLGMENKFDYFLSEIEMRRKIGKKSK